MTGEEKSCDFPGCDKIIGNGFCQEFSCLKHVRWKYSHSYSKVNPEKILIQEPKFYLFNWEAYNDIN